VTAVLAVLACQMGCTVVTSCPTTQPSQNNSGNGGGSSGGGSSTGGSIGKTGLPPADWTNATANLAGKASECGSMSFVSAKPDEDLLIAGVSLDGLWSSTDGGMSWQAMGAGKGSDMITNRTSAIVYDPMSPMKFWESGLYNGGGVYLTEDDGQTFAQQGSVTHSDLVAIDFGDPDRKTMLSGGHEASRDLNLSTDGGKTWSKTGMGLPDNTNCTRPLIIDSQTFLVGCGGYGGGVTGIFRSEDGGKTWNAASSLGGAANPLRASDGAIYWTSPDTSLGRSTDDGVTWMQVTGKNVILSLSPVELPDGRIAAVAPVGVVVSPDQGMTWQLATAALPFNDPIGLAYSAQQRAFYIWHFQCNNAVPDDAIMRAAFDYEAKPQ